MTEKKELDLRVNRIYKVGSKAGESSFSELYDGVNVNTGEEISIKLEKTTITQPKLIYEAKIMRLVRSNVTSGGPGT